MKKFVAGWTILGAVVVFFMAAILYKINNTEKSPSMTANEPVNFDECMMKRDSKLLESFPRVCQTKEGAQFTEDISKAPTASPVVREGVTCKVTGCSGTVCIDEDAEDIATTCEYQKEYACYEMMTCERQLDGNCGWTATEASDSCFAQNVVEPSI